MSSNGFRRKITSALAQKLLFVSLLVLSPYSFAQTPPDQNESSIADASKDLLSNPDDVIPFSEEQNDHAARIYVQNQKRVLNEVLSLAAQLDEKRISILFELGQARVRELREVNDLPETNILERKKKAVRLEKLGNDVLKAYDWSTKEGVEQVGQYVYDQRSLLGLQLETLKVSNEIGEAEPTSDNQIIYPRVLHHESGIVFFLVPSELDFDNETFQRHMARVRTLSNRGQGRPEVILSARHTSVDGSENTIRYRFFDTPKTWKEKAQLWWNANYVAPDKGAIALTATSVAIQVARSELGSYANYVLGHGAWDHTAAELSVAFGSVFGLWSSFYSNMTNPRDPLSNRSRAAARMRRIVISSVSFAYTYQIMAHGIDTLSLETFGGWLTNLSLWGNAYVGGAIADQFRQYILAREEMGLSRGKVKLLGQQVKKNQLERSLIAEVPRSIKMLDLMGIGTIAFSVAVPHLYAGQVKMPIGSLIFYSSYIWTQYLVLRYAEKMNYKYAPDLRRRWENFTGIPTKATQFITNVVARNGRYIQNSIQFMVNQPKEYLKDVWNSVRSMGLDTVAACRFSLHKKAVLDKTFDPPFKISEDGDWLEADLAPANSF